MAAVQVFILSIVLLVASSSLSITVSQIDEDRAINATREMIQRLQQQMGPGRVRNVNCNS